MTTPRSGEGKFVWCCLLWSFGCGDTGWSASERALIHTLTPLPPALARPTNRYADSADAAALGARLFDDPNFSANRAVACATCHVPARHFTDGLPVPNTLGPGKRNTPSIETSAWSTWFFWDGRADSAWAQVAGPLLNPIEHASSKAEIYARVLAVYADDWTLVYGAVPIDETTALAQFGKAIEAFERTLSPGTSRFDRWALDLERGDDSDVLSLEEKRGLHRFLGPDGCVNCHNGPLFTDASFHNIGLPQIANGGVDAGRALGASQVLEDPLNCRGTYSDSSECAELHFLDPSFPDWAAAFKTPSLRNVAFTAPYMHDGTFPSLRSVLEFYNVLPGQPIVGHRELTLTPLRLSGRELDDLEAFLGALSAEREL